MVLQQLQCTVCGQQTTKRNITLSPGTLTASLIWLYLMSLNAAKYAVETRFGLSQVLPLRLVLLHTGDDYNHFSILNNTAL